jgi:hypothetical protein
MTAPEPTPTELQLYQLAVEMADRVSARRGAANAFFVTLQTSFLAFGTISSGLLSRTMGVSVGACAAGILLSAAWWLQLRSYRELNRAKFAVILELEARLPFQLYQREWQALTSQPTSRFSIRYAELGRAERVIPIVFALLYVAAFVTRDVT